ncbi:MAG: TetR/AcrR family transcriptional regulator [Nevskiales bacterium]
MVKQARTTRKKLLEEAKTLFAARGFYGTSLSDVATRVSISKPSLLHHFPSKEKLYGAVLEEIAARILQELERDIAASHNPREQLHRFVDGFSLWSRTHRRDALILMRELLDNPERAPRATTWYFTPFFKGLMSIVESGQRSGLFKPVNAQSFIYNLIGAYHYFIIMLPTLKQILDADSYKNVLENQHLELKQMIDDRLLRQHVPTGAYV